MAQLSIPYFIIKLLLPTIYPLFWNVYYPISDHFVFVSDFQNSDHVRCLTPKTPDDHEWWCPYGIQIEIVPLPESNNGGGSRKSSTSSRKSSHSKRHGLFVDEKNDCFVVVIDISFFCFGYDDLFSLSLWNLRTFCFSSNLQRQIF